QPTAPTKTLWQQSLHKTELTARLRRHRKIPVSKTGNHIHPILQQSPCGRRWPREARSDEGCSREHQRLTPLEHPSSVSALRADPPSPTRGEGRARLLRRPVLNTVPHCPRTPPALPV